MTKLQKAWRDTAIAFELEPSKRTLKQRDITGCGLCNALCCTLNLDGRDRQGPYDRLMPLYGGGKNGMWMPYEERKSDLARATFAWLMAAMSDAERNAIKEGL